MEMLRNAKIATKVLSLLLLLGLLTVGVAYAGSRAVLRVDTTYSDLVNNKLPSSTMLARANRRGLQMVYAAYRAITYDGARQEARDASAQEMAAFSDAKALISEAMKAQPKKAEQIAAFAIEIDKLHVITSRAVALGQRDEDAAAKATIEKADAIYGPLAESFRAFNSAQIKESEQTSDELSKSVASTSFTLLLVSVLGVAAGIGGSFLIARGSIVRPLNALQDTMKSLAGGDNAIEVPGVGRGDEIGAMASAVLVFRDAAVALEAVNAEKAISDEEQQRVVGVISTSLASLAQGDLTQDIATEFSPVYAVLKTNFNEALTSLRTLIGAVGGSAEAIRTGSTEIASASEDLARRTEGNAASLEETSAALVQIDGRLKASAAASVSTVARADQAIATVGGGRAIAEEAVQAMGRVSDSAKGIDSVIEGLDKIAFQTRVLAMNAAVEAGRAGDAGRGFAVVADLVSALAMRAEEEAKRARDQLTVTQTDIVTAVDAVQRVDGALSNISGDVGEVHKLLGGMAEDNQAQSAAITQITAAVGSMDQSTQENAAMVEETSAAARNLTSEVANLAEQAAAFKVDGSAPRKAPSVSVAHPKPSAKARPSSSRGYVSPVKALPGSVISKANGHDADNWSAF